MEGAGAAAAEEEDEARTSREARSAMSMSGSVAIAAAGCVILGFRALGVWENNLRGRALGLELLSWGFCRSYGGLWL